MKNWPNMDIKKKNNKYIYIKYKQITNLINKLNNFVFQFFNIIKIMFHDLKCPKYGNITIYQEKNK